MNNGPELWNLILGKMPAGSVIAGGAVRDFLLGVEPKDIDVFIGPVPVAEGFEIHDPRVGLDRVDDRHERCEEYAAMTNILCVSTGEMFGYRVDAIELSDFGGGQALVGTFDFGLTRCWYDGEIHDTAEATTDRQHKTVTLLLEDRIERSRARFERFNERMGGGWRLVPAEHYEVAA